MPQSLTSLTIFASGPNDVESEKAALGAVIADVSAILEKTHKVTLRLVRWPDTIRPGVATDPQRVINNQVGEEYDIYIGVLSARFGQPTAKAESGTEEEFNEALDRFHRDPTSLRILVYFKNAELNPFTIDISQLEKVRKFRDQLGQRGVLYNDFRDTAQFVELTKKHIHHLVLDEFVNGCWENIPSNRGTNDNQVTIPAATGSGVVELTETNEDDDSPGLFELVEEIERGTKTLNEIMFRMTESALNVGIQFQQRTVETNSFLEQQDARTRIGGDRQGQLNVGRAKLVVNQAARDLDTYATLLSIDVKQFQVEVRPMLHNIKRALELQREFDVSSEEIDRRRTQMLQLIDTFRVCRDRVTEFQATISRMPALTGGLRKARKRTSGMLGEFIAELQLTIQGLDELTQAK